MTTKDPVLFPELRTTRHLLRRILPSDRPALFAGLSHPDVIAHYGVSYDTEQHCQEQLDWYRYMEQAHCGYWWAICPLSHPRQLIGACGIYEIDHHHHHGDLGYWLLPPYWRQGIMRECLLTVLHYGFTQRQLHRIQAEVEPDNLASHALLKQLGFHLEGTRRQVAKRHHGFTDLQCYGLLAKEFSAS